MDNIPHLVYFRVNRLELFFALLTNELQPNKKSLHTYFKFLKYRVINKINQVYINDMNYNYYNY